MKHPGFFERAGPFPLGAVLERTGAEPVGSPDPGMTLTDVRPLDAAGEGHISFIDNPRYLPQFERTRATACFVPKRFARRTPSGVIGLATSEPYRCFAQALALFYPEAGASKITGNRSDAANAFVDPSATIEKGATIEPGAFIAAEAAIGRGATISVGAVIGYRVHVGRGTYIGPNAVVAHALVGDRVVIHAGVSIGQDGFGFAMGRAGHLKVPQIGRVIIQDDVEIGANTTIDRGALRDTIVGEGTKIDNLVQIGHNVVIGRHCVIVAQTGISGSSQLEDHVVLGGQVGVVGHVRIGAGAQIAGSSNVRTDVPAGVRWGGTPAKPVRIWFRELTLLRKLAERKSSSDAPDDRESEASQ